MSRPDHLLAECRGTALRILSEYKNIHFQGLQVASRRCQELPRPLRKRLMQMEIAHNIVRHVTLPSCNALLNERKKVGGLGKKRERETLSSDATGAPCRDGSGAGTWSRLFVWNDH
eukprot:TRINITY_DN21528_c0_g2_i5.p2 TRINITY_DN21528_c0_g2~~TRINITY_DN21528_c0_g2_i5.p2  ORF type:complete len:116 (+),score=13.58 TRINITY_DN21528_c0_g2_i5:88-435(+)